VSLGGSGRGGHTSLSGFQRDEGLSALVRVRGAAECVTGGGHASRAAAAEEVVSVGGLPAAQ
jgi:hypothetical protein